MKNIIKYLIGFTILVLPALAFAQFDPPADDISIKILDQLFGGLFNGGNDVFGKGILIFNGAILTIGGILAAYTILAGTLGTAHDGEMLGKKFSSVWIPIRYSVGTAVILPVLPGGYCIMSQLVAGAISIGVGIAGAVWDGYLEHPTQSANVSYPTTGRNEIIKLAENAFTASVCVNAYQTFVDNYDKADGLDTLGYRKRYVFSKGVDSLGNITYGYQGGAVSQRVCGSITMANKIGNVDSTIPDHNINNVDSTNTGYLGNLDNLFKSTDITPINTASVNETKKLAESMNALAIQAIADKDIANNGESYYKKIEAAADTYMQNMQSAARTVPEAKSTNDKNYGWILAGAYFNNIVHSNDQIHKALASYPSSKASKNLSFNNISHSDMAPYLIADQVLANSDIGKVVGSTNQKSETAENGDSGFGISAWIGNQLASMVSGVDLYGLKNDSRHPVIIVNEMGNRILGVWTTFFALTVATDVSATAVKDASGTVVGQIATVGGLVPVGTGAAAIIAGLNTTLKFVMAPITALLIVGFTCAYLIPMIPFIMWLGCVGGWVIQCIIAIIVAPLWAVMHLHPNGDDLTGRGGNGYSMLMGLLLRPVLLILGFIASIAVSSVLGEFINKIYFQVFAFSGANVNGWLAFITMLAGATIYAVIMFSFIKRTHSIMHVIPDEIFKWIGGGQDGLGSYAQAMGDGAERSGASAAQALGAGGLLGVGLRDANANMKEDIRIYKDGKKYDKMNEAKNAETDENGNKVSNKSGVSASAVKGIVEETLKDDKNLQQLINEKNLTNNSVGKKDNK
ncbi:MAG: DotA/TraY family protein [Methylotenera sp.]|nr:DotA/TraY family protein [Methylotenera sp.]